LPPKRTPRHFQRHLADTVLPLVTGLEAMASPVSENTARKWIISIGYKYGSSRKNIYIDGHEHPGVIEQCKVLCEAWLGMAGRMKA
jgi:hypothetical protein